MFEWLGFHLVLFFAGHTARNTHLRLVRNDCLGMRALRHLAFMLSLRIPAWWEVSHICFHAQITSLEHIRRFGDILFDTSDTAETSFYDRNDERLCN